jgi:predicted Zn-dependent protease with MMP-like domain
MFDTDCIDELIKEAYSEIIDGLKDKMIEVISVRFDKFMKEVNLDEPKETD